MTADPPKGTLLGRLGHRRLMSRDPIVRYYLRWAAIYLGILTVFGLVLLQIGVRRGKISDQMDLIRSKMQSMAQPSMTPEKRDDILQQIQKSAEWGPRQFIRAADVPSIISTISAAAAANQIQLKKVNSLPVEPILGFSYERLTMQVDLEGDYAKIGGFVLELKKRIPTFFTWEKVKISGNPKKGGGVLMEIKMAFYSKK